MCKHFAIALSPKVLRGLSYSSGLSSVEAIRLSIELWPSYAVALYGHLVSKKFVSSSNSEPRLPLTINNNFQVTIQSSDLSLSSPSPLPRITRRSRPRADRRIALSQRRDILNMPEPGHVVIGHVADPAGLAFRRAVLAH